MTATAPRRTPATPGRPDPANAEGVIAVIARAVALVQDGAADALTTAPINKLALKQGAGRLIRRETDTGLLVICDTRLLTMGYGRRLLAALPPMPQLAGPADLAQMLDRLVAQSQGAPAVAD